MLVYVSIADEIIKGHWNANHFFQSIGYPLIIVVAKKLSTNWGLVLNIFHILASMGTLVFLYKLTSRSFGIRIGILSLFVGSLHLPWILLPSFALAETIFTFFLSAAAWYSYKIFYGKGSSLDCFLWSASFMCAFWLKGTHALWAPLLFLALFIYKGRASLKPLLLMGLTILVGLSLHGSLAYLKIGKVQLSASAGGLNFLEGKCPAKRNEDSLGYWWQSPLYTQLYMNEYKKWSEPFTNSSYFMKEGLKCIEKNPLVLIQSFESIPFLFFGNRMWPFTDTHISHYTRLYELFFSFFVVVGIGVMFRELFSNDLKTEDKLIWFLPVLSLFLCVYIFKSEMRFRVPFDFWFIPISVQGWWLVFERKPFTKSIFSYRKLASN